MQNTSGERDQRIVSVNKREKWLKFSALCTIMFPSFLLSAFGMKSKEMRRAWREKIALCWMIVLACCVLAFITYGMTMLICIPNTQYTKEVLMKGDSTWISARGKILLLSEDSSLAAMNGQDLSSSFKLDAPSCNSAFGKDIVMPGANDLSEYSELGPFKHTWSSVVNNKLLVIGSTVYNVQSASLPPHLSFLKSATDATRAAESMRPIELQCLKESCYAGDLAIKTFGCQLTDAFLYLSGVTILGMVLIRFFLALAYSLILKIQTWRIMRNTQDTIPVVLMATCYSEGREGLKSTLDSLCAQEYDKKLIFVIADGFITGAGNEASTPEILKSMITPSPEFDGKNPPQQYISIAAGDRKLNHAEVHAGTYTAQVKNKTYTTNIILILKTGNRGKRDSQMIVMSFFHRILYKARLTQLDLDLYRKIKRITGLHPSMFGAVLMVDADTSVRPGALRIMARTMQHDETIMGICGETLIENKFGSWVSAIQVFEYYVSHHLAKGFESVFGNVTCLPGCFCMYRIRVERKKEWAPILVAPSVLHSYGSDETKSLHEKNLLLLGEDRYLTTLLLKNFPKKKLIFIPAAQCDTTVPDKFSVLLSQRRRWINSTIHNLFELLKVDLCGTFFCSMQFIVVLELFGTLVLPAAIIFTGILLLTAFLIQPVWLPLILLAAIVVLPLGLIFFTNFNLFYLFWFFVYVVSLPIWNFVLPIYAFWHFDDFSWGETRKIDALEGKPVGHGEEESKSPLNTPQETSEVQNDEQELVQSTSQMGGHGTTNRFILTNYEEI
ncbi:chitin synthase [Nematocida sp. LUAm3]|nr:chitin synthase [Nematocida sp. LUAm3]KAI5174493.1 chitin synthase [Nematocida sp. LUAm2]KAI5179144.1 chitin synthase [Nematocida sp. LUAm1]